ncbi:hypothetical protein GBB84_29100, partial [Citrobacter sp. NMI7905_11]|nr:hypothetical protein [Citrobacter telavivensis]
FSDSALAAMGRHDWPGNVRELANRVRRGLVLAEGRQIEAPDLGLHDQVAQEALLGTLEDYKHRAERQADGVGAGAINHGQNSLAVLLGVRQRFRAGVLGDR